MRAIGLVCAATLVFARAVLAAEGDPVVSLESEQVAGLAVASAEAAEAPVSTAAIGQVLDPLPFVEALLARATARTASEIAERELARVEALSHADHNASLRDVEAARLAATRARGELAGAEARAAGIWGAAVLATPGLDALVEQLARGAAGLARLDLPGADATSAAPTHAWVTAPAFAPAERAVRILGAAPNADPGLQARALLVAIDAPPLPIGAALFARVEVAAVARGVWLPAGAVVWNDGASAVFVARGANQFERRAVQLFPTRRAGFSIAQGLAPGDRFVVSGAQQLLSAQLVGAAPEE